MLWFAVLAITVNLVNADVQNKNYLLKDKKLLTEIFTISAMFWMWNQKTQNWSSCIFLTLFWGKHCGLKAEGYSSGNVKMYLTDGSDGRVN